MAVNVCPFDFVFVLAAFVMTYHWIQMRGKTLSKTWQLVYSYGKCLDVMETPESASTIVDVVTYRLPKHYFRYFYDFAINVFFWMSILLPYIMSSSHLRFIVTFPTSILFGRPEESLLTANNRWSYWICLILMIFQVGRRSYESRCISVFSPKSEITLIQVIVGFGYYPAVALALINLRLKDTDIPFSHVHLTGIVAFLFGSFLQHQSLVILSRLRKRAKPTAKDEKVIITYGHLIPVGGGFDFVSNPHYFAEIVIYFGLFLTSNMDQSFGCLLAFVVAAHLLMAQQSHDWYLKKFAEDYPNGRKILIPFVV